MAGRGGFATPISFLCATSFAPRRGSIAGSPAPPSRPCSSIARTPNWTSPNGLPGCKPRGCDRLSSSTTPFPLNFRNSVRRARSNATLGGCRRYPRTQRWRSSTPGFPPRRRDGVACAGLRAPEIAIVPLGVDAVFAETRRSLARRPEIPYFVYVGTIEPRKNLLFLLAVWRRLVERHGAAAPRLVIAGRRGWENENIVDVLDRSRQLAPFVAEASDLTDAGLARLLADSAALVAPSFAEGFGLPVVECLAAGAPGDRFRYCRASRGRRGLCDIRRRDRRAGLGRRRRGADGRQVGYPPRAAQQNRRLPPIDLGRTCGERARPHGAGGGCGLRAARPSVNVSRLTCVLLWKPAPALNLTHAPMYDLIELFYFAYRDFVGDADRLLEAYGFGRAHHRVLHFVARRPGLTIAELLDILAITKQSLNRVLKELVAQDFIEARAGAAGSAAAPAACDAEGRRSRLEAGARANPAVRRRHALARTRREKRRGGVSAGDDRPRGAGADSRADRRGAGDAKRRRE